MVDVIKKKLSHVGTAKDVAAMGGAAGVAKAIAEAISLRSGTPVSGPALLEGGLTPAQAAASAALFGSNRLETKPIKPFWEHFKEAFEDRTLQVRLRRCSGPRLEMIALYRRRHCTPRAYSLHPHSLTHLQILCLSAAVSCFFAAYQREMDEVLQAIMMFAVIALVSGMYVASHTAMCPVPRARTITSQPPSLRHEPDIISRGSSFRPPPPPALPRFRIYLFAQQLIPELVEGGGVQGTGGAQGGLSRLACAWRCGD